MKGLVHSIHGKESCQDKRLNHENKLHKFSNRYLFYVPEIHRTLGLMSNCYKRRKGSICSHRERKIYNKKYTAVDE